MCLRPSKLVKDSDSRPGTNQRRLSQQLRHHEINEITAVLVPSLVQE